MGGVFYEYGFFVLKDAGSEMGWEGIDGSERRRSGVMRFHYSPKVFFSKVVTRL